MLPVLIEKTFGCFCIQVPISVDALRMRCRRLCEKKPSGRAHVPEETISEYKVGGQSREILELGLLECLARHGLDRKAFKKVKAWGQQIHIYIFIFIYPSGKTIIYIYPSHLYMYIIVQQHL